MECEGEVATQGSIYLDLTSPALALDIGRMNLEGMGRRVEAKIAVPGPFVPAGRVYFQG